MGQQSRNARLYGFSFNRDPGERSCSFRAIEIERYKAPWTRHVFDGSAIVDDASFCRYLLDACDVAVVPGSCFGLAPYFRLSYAAADADLEEACARIARACAALQ